MMFFNDTATTEIYTLSLHDALPIYAAVHRRGVGWRSRAQDPAAHDRTAPRAHREDAGLVLDRGRCRGRRSRARVQEDPRRRSEEHTSELQSRQYLVCRLLLEKQI